jgi:hypothetical protein
VAGTVVVTHCTDRGTGRCYGDFRSDNGRIRLVSTRIWGEDDAGDHTHLRAYDDTARQEVDVPDSASNVTISVVALVVGLAVWAVLALVATRAWRRRTRPTPVRAGG